MRRLASLALLILGASSVSALSQPDRRLPAEVGCIDAKILTIAGIARTLTAPHDGGRLAISVTLENRTARSVSFVLNFTAPNVQMAAVNQWRRLEPQSRGTYLAGTLPRGTLVSDDEVRAHVQLRCVR
ncbi:hypothetical protein [Roseococcus sp.]|uniref:hypothetical protein n=1 Tax=Roseococcus sp. TaxID=2109646 RepID=UPI003BAC2CE7